MKQVNEPLNPNLPEPERWCDRPVRGTTAENTVGAIFKRVRQATEPSDVALARLARRMEAPPRSGTARFVWRVVLAAALVVAMGGAVGAALNKWRRAGIAASARMSSGEATVAPAKNHHARRGQRLATTAADHSVAPPTEAPPAETTAPVEPTAAPQVPQAPQSVQLQPPRSQLPRRQMPPSEAGTLADAFRELRSNGDPASALRSLDQYELRFPSGALRGEAGIARAEALIALDRRAEALPVLDRIEESGGAVTRNVRITRGELLAEAGRCARAIGDFDTVLASRDDDAAGGRALYGRASCHMRAGDITPARRDLTRYLARHPGGDFARAARQALDSLP